MQLISLIVR